MAVSGTNEILPVDEVLENVFNLPKDTNQTQPNWTTRPMDDKTKVAAAANVSFLLELQHTLTYEYLLAPFFKTAYQVQTQLSSKYEVQMAAKPVNGNAKENVEFKEILQMKSLNLDADEEQTVADIQPK